MKIMRFSDNNKEKQLRRIKSTVTQSQVQESNDGHPLGKMLSGKMLAPSPAFQKALMGWYLMGSYGFRAFKSFIDSNDIHI